MIENLYLKQIEETLDYKFKSKPLLVGGGAMEYYDLRPIGIDIDYILTEGDYAGLATKTPDNLKIFLAT